MVSLFFVKLCPYSANGDNWTECVNLYLMMPSADYWNLIFLLQSGTQLAPLPLDKVMHAK